MFNLKSKIMKKLLYASLVISIIVVLIEITYISETSLAWVIIALAVAIGLQGIYLLRK